LSDPRKMHNSSEKINSNDSYRMRSIDW
jgi:hypothetical protein